MYTVKWMVTPNSTREFQLRLTVQSLVWNYPVGVRHPTNRHIMLSCNWYKQMCTPIKSQAKHIIVPIFNCPFWYVVYYYGGMLQCQAERGNTRDSIEHITFVSSCVCMFVSLSKLYKRHVMCTHGLGMRLICGSSWSKAIDSLVNTAQNTQMESTQLSSYM